MPTTDPIFEPHGDELDPSRGRPPPYDRRMAGAGSWSSATQPKGVHASAVRLASNVTTEEYAHLARAMTLKNAPGLPRGADRSGIATDGRRASRVACDALTNIGAASTRSR